MPARPRGDSGMYVRGMSFPDLSSGTGGRVSSRVTPAEPWLATASSPSAALR